MVKNSYGLKYAKINSSTISENGRLRVSEKTLLKKIFKHNYFLALEIYPKFFSNPEHIHSRKMAESQ